MANWRHTKPYSQQFLFKVNEEFAGKTLLEFYTTKFAYKTQEFWKELIENGDTDINHQGVTPDTILKLDDEIRTRRHDVQEPDVNVAYEILFEDEGVLVINKPAPLPVHPSGRYYKNTLTTVLREDFPDKKFHTIHRLDKWTTGVLILATDPQAARHLHLQVEKQLLQKEYGVLAVGDFAEDAFTIDAAIGRVKGAHRGTGEDVTEAKASVTEFTVMDVCGENTLLKAVPITGRTNQIRVHVQAAGGYVMNDPLYSPHKKAEDEMIPFLGLHCRSMGFELPSGKHCEIKAPWPEHYQQAFPKISF